MNRDIGRADAELTLLNRRGEGTSLYIDFGFGEKGDKGDTPIKGVDYWTEEDKAEMGREIREALSYNKVYDMTNAQLSEDISGEDIEWDEAQGMHRAIGEVRIKMPRRFDYWLGLTIGQRFDEGEISVQGESHRIENNMTFFLEDVEEIVFSVDVYVWIKSITVQTFKLNKVPTKLSELENDRNFVSVEIIGEKLTLNTK